MGLTYVSPLRGTLRDQCSVTLSTVPRCDPSLFRATLVEAALYVELPGTGPSAGVSVRSVGGGRP